MTRYLIEIEASDGFPDQFEVDMSDREAVRVYVIELASDRLQSEAKAGRPMIVDAVIRDEQGEILDTVRSRAEIPG